MKLLVTGGAGFIGSAFVRLMLSQRRAEVTVVDKLTYAGNLENLLPVNGVPGYRFVQGDICDGEAMDSIVAPHRPDAIVNFAAESHVDRSILAPLPVFESNLRGVFTLLEIARRHDLGCFVQVSTDEVYGSLPAPVQATEDFPLRASSPYSACKAGADLLTLSYGRTFGVPVIVTRAANNYGPYQFPEKLIPLMISNALEDRPLPVYGDGRQERDWLYVDDHCEAIYSALLKGTCGSIYNIGASEMRANLDVIAAILKRLRRPDTLIEYIADRPAHDRRYALSSAKLTRETGWRPAVSFDEGLERTIGWYEANIGWVKRIKSGSYQTYYRNNYADRAVAPAR